MSAVLDPAAVARGLRDRAGQPRVGLVLGSGLGALADELAAAVSVPFSEIPGFAAAGVVGHAGSLVTGLLEGVPCAALQGRPHLYEGHGAAVVAFPARVLVALGVRALIVTNAAGGINPRFRPGDVMLLDDHINLLWRNPLIGPVRQGEQRFPDMSAPYDRELQRLAERCALEQRVRLVRGVYLAVPGPSYETRAEIAMFRRLGADAIGMSTVPEVLVARAAGVPVLGLSLITNPAADLSAKPLDHADVIAAGEQARVGFSRLIRHIVRELAAYRM
jgi:purine-nucleoside phosphorylase